MSHNASYNLHGTQIMACAREGKKLRSDRDAVELIAELIAEPINDTFEHGAGLIVIPAERLDDDFFRLKTCVAGEMLQKFVNYRTRVAILGDISSFVAESAALRDFVYESNRGNQIWFVANHEELDERLKKFALVSGVGR